MTNSVRYMSGEVVRAGDVLDDETWQSSRVVVVIPAGEAVDGYESADWAYLLVGIMVEHRNASGVHLVHYERIDEDFVLLHRDRDGA